MDVILERPYSLKPSAGQRTESRDQQLCLLRQGDERSCSHPKLRHEIMSIDIALHDERIFRIWIRSPSLYPLSYRRAPEHNITLIEGIL